MRFHEVWVSGGNRLLHTMACYVLRLVAIRLASRDNISSYIINSLAPGKFEWTFRHVIFKQILLIDGWDISCEIAIIWMPLDFTDDQSR